MSRRSASTPVPIDRMSGEDLMSLAGDNGSAPMQAGAVLLLSSDGALDVGALLAALEQRLGRVPRLRRRMMEAPLGGGRPVWVDDPGFRLSDHVAVVTCRGGNLEREALHAAAELMTTRLDRARPLWTARLLVPDGGEPAGAALVVVFHHVLADGIAGLAVLGALTDDAADEADQPGDLGFPRSAPTARQLRLSAARDRLHGVLTIPSRLRRLAGGLRQLLPALGTRAPRISLNRPTGPRRRFVAVQCQLADVRAAGAASGATVNDVLLTVVAGSLAEMLAARGQHVDRLIISVPFSGRQRAGAGDLGNRSGVVPFAVPTQGPALERLTAVHELSARAKRGERGASAAILGPAFRLLAGSRLYRSFIDSQRLVHTIVTNVRGPDHPLRLGGLPITRLIPLSVATGNIPVAFAGLSYAGEFTITLVADPDAVPDLDVLHDALLTQLSGLGIPAR
jgi:WS/DGAT/MGAT family acyltransferase